MRSLIVIFTSGLLLGAIAGLTGCANDVPVADKFELAGAQTQRAVVGYEKVDYEYPIRVPGSNRYVTMKSKEPLDEPPTYDDYLDWKASQQ
ncbi:hypothetical protein [Cerasicoccus maritimus]|uniref:hypothetical protein n=1 Tax=Cerasicoccus maritimus TaxID=490089 RepID=UPI002852A066|nr:hypothetical protein [Cerasicoccus maritimus]